jgi:hypothetical protein
MKLTLGSTLALAGMLMADGKPRIYITEGGAQVTAGGVIGDETAAVAVNNGTSPENIEVMKAFSRLCPGVIVTSKRERADYIVRFDRESPSPVTPFVKGNKVAVFNRDEDLVYSNSTRLLGNAVKGTCTALTAKP